MIDLGQGTVDRGATINREQRLDQPGSLKASEISMP